MKSLSIHYAYYGSLRCMSYNREKKNNLNRNTFTDIILENMYTAIYRQPDATGKFKYLRIWSESWNIITTECKNKKH